MLSFALVQPMRKLTYIFLLLLFAGLEPSFAQVQSRSELAGKSAYIQGMEAFVNEEYELSRDLLLTAYSELGANASISFALADTYSMLNDLPNAALYGKQAVNLEPENKWYRFKLAEIYRSAGQNQATLNELNKLLEYHPNDFDALFMLANTYQNYGEYFKSNQILNRALNLTGPNKAIFFLKFKNFEALAIRDSMRVQLEALRDLNPDDLNTLNLLGEFYSITGEKGEARTVLSDALTRNSRDPQSLINLAGLYIDVQKWDSAGTLMGNFVTDKLIQPEQKIQVAQYLVARHAKEPNSVQLRIEAARLLDLLCEAEPEYGLAFVLAGQFYAQNNQFDEALNKLERGNQLLPNDEMAWRLRLQLLLGEEKHDEAIEVGKKANKVVPEDAFIQFFVGSAYLLKDDNATAVEWLENASRAPARRPFKSIIYTTLADAQGNLKNYEESDSKYELALRYDPENDVAMNNYAYNLSVRGENLEKAKELALKAIETAPENAAYLDTIGWVYFKLGDYERARRYVKASIDTGSASAEVSEHLGDVYEKLDNLHEANKWWKQALEMDSTRVHLKDKIDTDTQ